MVIFKIRWLKANLKRPCHFDNRAPDLNNNCKNFVSCVFNTNPMVRIQLSSYDNFAVKETSLDHNIILGTFF